MRHLAHETYSTFCDRANDRIQVFKSDGTFVKEKFIEKQTRFGVRYGFSADLRQKYL
jgi:hypothetical protein